MSYRPSPIPFLERAGVKLIPCGSDKFRLACPVHQGTNASMILSREPSAVWMSHCFACGFSGDALALVMAVRGCRFPEALRELDCTKSDDRPPVELHRRETITVACDAPGCGTTFDAVGREYKVPGKLGKIWSTTATEEAFFLAASRGWEMGAEGVGALCVECIS